jgi:hypothetical protein
MSAEPTTIPMEPIPATIARAYAELAVGLGRLTDGVERGDVRSLLPGSGISLDLVGTRPLIVLPGDPIVIPDRAVERPHGAIEVPEPEGRRLVDNRLAAMAIELTKTAAVVLVVYQGALSFLPAPPRPHFAPARAEASPAVKAVLPSVTPAAPTAADGQQTEVEVDGDGSSQPTAVP